MEVDVPYNWIDATSGSVLYLADDDAESISLPFSFQFYDQVFSTVCVESNGWLSFNNYYPDYYSYHPFPSTNPTHYYAIALFCDDLYPASNVYYLPLTNPNRVVFEYHNIDHFGFEGRAGSFEVILFETGGILFQYDYIDVVGTPTVGLNYGLDPAYFNVYYGLTSATEDLAIRFTYPIPDHDVRTSLETPSFLTLGETTILNATVANRGLSNETDVELQLWLNSSLVANETYPSLLSWASMTLSYPWTPSQLGNYNVTAYTIPVENENSTTDNNAETKFVAVIDPSSLIGFIHTHEEEAMPGLKTFYEGLGYYVNEIDSYITDALLSNYHIIFVSESYYGTGWNVNEIATLENWMQNGGTLVGLGDQHLADFEQLASSYGITFLGYAMGSSGSTTVIDPSHPLMSGITSLYLPNVYNALDVTDPAIPIFWDRTGAGVYGATVFAGSGQFYVIADDLYLNIYDNDNEILFENILTSQRFDHDLCASLEVSTNIQPNETTIINATVTNWGLNNEIDVVLQLFINGTQINSTTIPEMPNGTSQKLSYLWNPNIEGIYNVTAYVVPVPDENVTINNFATQFVLVRVAVVGPVLVYTDDSIVSPTSRYLIVALDNLGIAYTVYHDDPNGFGTALTIEESWDLVIVSHINYYTLGNWWEELENYVLNSGRLIISTFDVDGSHSETTTLWETMGATWYSHMNNPEPVYLWNPEHSIFNTPNVVGNLTAYTNNYFDHGDHLTATTGTPIAGFSASPTANDAAIVVGNLYPTILISFALCEFRSDEDTDGKLDAVELWENLIIYSIFSLKDTPTLTDGIVSPSTGTTSTTFTYSTNYTDANNDTPTIIQVIIDGIQHNMTKQNPSDNIYTDGCIYVYTTTLSEGSHDYHFEASDGNYSVRSPYSGENSGPSISKPIPGFTWSFAILGLVMIISLSNVLKRKLRYVPLF
ncbi:MAG: CARDB domain-containing protein [Promethearchaeota archaeon]